MTQIPMTGGRLRIVLAVLILVLCWYIFGLYGFWSLGNFPREMKGNWQAVFLDNNQTYFGKLEDYNYGYVALSNVYYLRSGELQKGEDAAPNLSLVKLGGELHVPEDKMYIRKESIEFWENLRDESRVVQLIRTMR